MAKIVNCTEEVVIVSNGKGDNGKLVALGDGGKLDPSVIPAIANGSTWFNGAADPDSNSGIAGDYYLNTVTGNVFQKTESGTWAVVANIKGPQGIQGAKGDGFDTGSSFTQNGYQILSNGLIFQWGRYGTFTAANQRKTINFNINFPTEVLNIQCTSIIPNTSTNVGVPEVISYTNASFDILDGDTDNTPWDIFWFAIGH